MVSARNNNVTFISLIRVCMCFFWHLSKHRMMEPAKTSKKPLPIYYYCYFFSHEYIQSSKNSFSIVPLLVCSNICSFVRFILLLIKMPIIIDLVFIAIVALWQSVKYGNSEMQSESDREKGLIPKKIRRNVASYLHILLIKSESSCFASFINWISLLHSAIGWPRLSSVRSRDVPLLHKRISNLFSLEE